MIYAKGPNPDTDEYRVVYPLGKDKITGFKLEAVRHPKMTKGGLARSDSGNFVLTDIQFNCETRRWTSSFPSRYKAPKPPTSKDPSRSRAPWTTTRNRVGGLVGQADRPGPRRRLPLEGSHRATQGSRIGNHPQIQFQTQEPQPRTFQVLGHRPTRALAQRSEHRLDPGTTQASGQTQSRRRKDNLRGLFQEGRRPRLFAQEEGRFGKETQRLPSHQGTQSNGHE